MWVNLTGKQKIETLVSWLKWAGHDAREFKGGIVYTDEDHGLQCYGARESISWFGRVSECVMLAVMEELIARVDIDEPVESDIPGMASFGEAVWDGIKDAILEASPCRQKTSQSQEKVSGSA